MVDIKKEKLDGFQLRKLYDEELKNIETRIDRLRALWDQYFMGLEKIPPTMAQSELERLFNRSDILRSRFTLHKYRFRMLQAKFTTLRTYWHRIFIKIENGEIRRGVMGRAEMSGLDDELKKELMEKMPLAAQGRRRHRKKTSDENQGPAQPEIRQFQPSEVGDIYQELVARKRDAGEPVERLSQEGLGKSIQKILDQYPNKDIRLKVMEKNGKITLVAVSKKSE